MDYARLYLDAYPGHSSGATSFPAAAVDVLRAMADDLGCRAVVDIGAGNGQLGRALGERGTPHCSFDLREDLEGRVHGFDLSASTPETAERARRIIAAQLPRPYLTCCLDVLEHIARQDLAAALSNLLAVTEKYLLCSISTRPSSEYNLYHATVIPTSVWRSLLAEAGFRAVAHPLLQQLRFHHEYPFVPHLQPVHQWRLMNPYREAQAPEPNYILLEKTEGHGSGADVRRILRLRDRHPLAAELSRGLHYHFLLGHTQNFSFYQAFWDDLDRDQVDVWLREDPEFGPTRYPMLVSYLRARGFEHVAVRENAQVEGLVSPHDRQVLVSASESTASESHMRNAAVVVAARHAGCPSVLLQHGIWLEDFADPIAFFSDRVLAWSEEHQASFETIADRSRRPRGFVAPGQFVVTGTPKFDAYASGSAVRIPELLGDWTRGYAETVLVTTNFSWHRHRMTAHTAYENVAEVAAAFPETLFVIKLHPVEDPEPAAIQLLPPNVVALSEPVCWCAEIRTSDLLRAADKVVTTLSTTALEAALARKPVCLIDTGTELDYANLPFTSIGDLRAFVGGREASPAGDAFTTRYFDRSTLGSGLERSLRAINALVDGARPRPRGAMDVRELALANYVSRMGAKLDAIGREPREPGETGAFVGDDTFMARIASCPCNSASGSVEHGATIRVAVTGEDFYFVIPAALLRPRGLAPTGRLTLVARAQSGRAFSLYWRGRSDAFDESRAVHVQYVPSAAPFEIALPLPRPSMEDIHEYRLDCFNGFTEPGIGEILAIRVD